MPTALAEVGRVLAGLQQVGDDDRLSAGRNTMERAVDPVVALMFSYGRVCHLDFVPSCRYSLALQTMPSVRQVDRAGLEAIEDLIANSDGASRVTGR
jgi:hypothetical protein